MTRILPVICLIGAVAAAVMSLLSLVFVILCAAIPAFYGLAVFAVPLLVASTVTAGLTTFANFIFLKDRLCRAGLLISVVGAAMVLASYAVLLLM